MNQELASSEEARNARDLLCAFIREHALNDRDRSLAQYVSLSLYLNPPPAFTLSIDKSDLPPDSAQVVGILPLLRSFGEAIHLNALWAAHHPDYQGLVERFHDPMTSMVLNTNLFLHMPTSSYDGRRFMVELEPMLPPSQTNARIYGSDYVIVVSPAAPVRRGDRVVVKTKKGEVMVKELKRQTAKQVELKSLNADHPERTLSLDDVDWIARIVWASQ